MDPELLRRWWRDHGEMDRALEDVRIELERGELAPGDDRLVRFTTALERHFATEEEIYFPLAARASAQSARLLDRAHCAHDQLRETVGDLRALVENAELAAARRAFAALLQRLNVHEEEEVAILVELERLVSSTAPA